MRPRARDVPFLLLAPANLGEGLRGERAGDLGTPRCGGAPPEIFLVGVGDHDTGVVEHHDAAAHVSRVAPRVPNERPAVGGIVPRAGRA